MALAAAGGTAAPGTESTQRNALIKLDVVADDGGFAHYDAGAVVDEEIAADLRAGVNVDTGAAVSVLRHHTGNGGDMAQVQFVTDPVGEDGKQTRIGQHDLLTVLGGGIAVEDGLDIRQQQLLDAGQLIHHVTGDLRGTGFFLHREHQRDLLGQACLDAFQQQRGIIRRRQRHQRRVAEISGKQQLTHFLQQRDDGLAVRQPQAAAVHGNGGVFHGGGHGFGRSADMIFVHGLTPPTTGGWTGSARRHPAAAPRWSCRGSPGGGPARRRPTAPRRR